MFIRWFALVTALGLAGVALVSTRRSHRRRRRLDWFYFCATLPFGCLAALDLMGARGWLSGALLTGATRLAYQLMILGVTALVLALLNGARPFQRWLFVAAAVFGGVLAVWPLAPLSGPHHEVWEGFNIVVISVFVATLAFDLWRHGGTRGWIVLLAVVPALGVLVSDLLGHAGRPLTVTWPQLFYTPILLVLWLVSTRRIKVRLHPSEVARAARRKAQLAQDLHDGVGSHLTAIISTLDADTPKERATALQLRECLAELKLLVDSEDEDASLLNLLAALRYRMGPLLLSGGVRLDWYVIDQAQLGRVRDGNALQISRVVQEALANVVEHAHADAVVVRCRYRVQHDDLMLEVIDNGIPWPRSGTLDLEHTTFQGKGVRGMHERARQLGGRLTIECGDHDTGTRVALSVPMQAVEPM